MLICRTACFFAALTLAAGALLAANDDPFVGTWKLDLAKSTYKGVPKPKELTLTIANQGNDRRVTFNGTNEDGSPIKTEMTEPMKGGPVQFTGAQSSPNFVTSNSGDKVTLKPINHTTEEMIYSKDGKEVAVRHIMMARNHKSFTAKFTGPDAHGKTITQNDVWQKQ